MKVTDEGVSVDTLVSVVKDSIKRAGVSRVSESADLRVASVQLILEVVASKTAGGGLNFRVPFIGMKLDIGVKVTKKDTHTIDITLVPPEQQATREVRSGEVEDVLVNAVATIRSVIAHARPATRWRPISSTCSPSSGCARGPSWPRSPSRPQPRRRIPDFSDARLPHPALIAAYVAHARSTAVSEDRQVQPGEAFEVGDELDGDDSPAGQGETECPGRLRRGPRLHRQFH